MRFDLAGGVSAVVLVVIGPTTLEASTAPQTPAAIGWNVPAAAANLQAGPPPASGENAGGGATVTSLPARMGRVSLVSGKVEFRGPGEAQWSLASINDPVTTGVALRTDMQSRTEVEFGANTIEIGEGSEITLTRLDGRTAEIALRTGRIDLDLRGSSDHEGLQIDIPGGAVRVSGRGRYDIDAVTGAHPTRLAAFAGTAEFVGGGVDVGIGARERVVFSAAGPAAATIEAVSENEFTRWCKARAVADPELAAPYFVSRELTGYTVLDAAGAWRTSDKYGEVWTPRTVEAGWTPYRDGHWRWLAPWGWSWVDDQPWGFATSHYGRWALIDGAWSWVPGRWTRDPVWAPAVVAFLGTPGVGLSYAGGLGPAIAWFPLAPGEIYWPSYTRDGDYIRAINRSNVADLSVIQIGPDGEPPGEVINAHFANRSFASVVPRPVFAAGQPVATALLTIPDERLRDAPAIMGSPDIGPPAPTPVHVAAAPTRAHQVVSVAATKPAKTTIWQNIVRAAAIRSRLFQESARLRFARLHGLARVEPSHIRHPIVLRVARADHGPMQSETHRRTIRR